MSEGLLLCPLTSILDISIRQPGIPDSQLSLCVCVVSDVTINHQVSERYNRVEQQHSDWLANIIAADAGDSSGNEALQQVMAASFGRSPPPGRQPASSSGHSSVVGKVLIRTRTRSGHSNVVGKVLSSSG